MTAASGSASICVSTGASPVVATTAVGTGHSAPTPPPPNVGVLVACDCETATTMGDVGRVEVDEGTCTGEVEPAVKKQTKCPSKVWEYYSKYSVTVKTKDGGEEIQVWAKCKKCPHKVRAETSRGTKALQNHV